MFKQTVSDKAPSFVYYSLSIVLSFLMMFCVVYPGFWYLNGYKINEVMAIPMGVAWFGFPALLFGFLLYPVFRMTFARLEDSYWTKVVVSWGMTFGVFYIAMVALYLVIFGSITILPVMNILLLPTGAFACFYYWLLTR